ncbi:hypothetical protein DFO70_104186 [Cytobacillus firmus]|uniref:Uncharacterized protein n=2 Tax=Cytobacillus TaxID=2675230 RepID=A0A366JYD4_CYTFI|nr:hypothetical protein DFO70_104186 [Cytobacillus firmus]TDX43293.1 hypothetical protein DFO72_105189 [Cytobacillus oceanisediminis]
MLKLKRGINREGEFSPSFCLPLFILRVFSTIRYNGHTNCEKERNLIFKKYPVMKLTW